MRAVGIDLGERRIGVAVTDAGGRLAVPYRILERSGNGARDRAALAAIVEEIGAGIVVVGLPIALSGKVGGAARAAAAEAAALGEVLPVPVVTFDERLTTVEAAHRRRERDAARRERGGVDASGRADKGGTPPSRRRAARPSGSSGRRRAPIDAEAAAIMLEAWLGAER
jgi:putative Holliday junction resolvase